MSVTPGFPATVRADVGRLQQILLNLVGNALKFTPEGQVALVIGADAPVDGRCRVQIIVSDTGIGIPADKIGRIFDPFIQADLSNTRRFGGVGLGLSIVRNLVKRMGGAIEVESAEGVGSVFRVTLLLEVAEALPVPSVREEEVARVVEMDRAASAGGAALRPHVLLVDDVSTSREVVRSFLQRAGCMVETAENGLEAVERCAQARYDIVFMDRHMPVMDGIEATRRIRAREELGEDQRLIVGLSAGALDEERQNCLAAGMDDYLTKPVRMARIVATIDAWRSSVAAVA